MHAVQQSRALLKRSGISLVNKSKNDNIDYPIRIPTKLCKVIVKCELFLTFLNIKTKFFELNKTMCFSLKITYLYASPRLLNQLPDSFRQLRSNQ